MVIKIIGKGAWGESIAEPLRDNGHEVVFQGRGEVSLADGDAVILSLPTNAIREALAHAKHYKKLRIINCTKGIEQKTHKLPYEIVRDLTHQTTEYYALLGPSFASELKEKMPTIVNLGFTGTPEKAQAIARLFITDYLRVHTVNHVASLELGSAMKNIFAIACGIADGLGYGLNTRIKVIIEAMEEYYVLCSGLNYPIDERAIGGIIGDFLLTGSSTESRNFTFGKHLVDHSIAAALKKVGTTVEGHASIAAIAFLIQKAGVQLPLATLVMQIVIGKNKTPIREQFLAFAQHV